MRARFQADGKIVRGEHAVGGLDVRAGKPEHIFAATGRLPDAIARATELGLL